MQQSLPQSEFVLIPNTTNAKKAVEYVNSYIQSCYCKNMSVDISFMNVIDACYVSTMCSAKHFSKYTDGKIKWKISSLLVKEFNQPISLGNDEYYI